MALTATENEPKASLPLPQDDSRLAIPTLKDVYLARQVVDRFLSPTPLLQPAALGEKLGCSLFLKCENLQPTGAFKVRGGINLLSALTEKARKLGVVTASTGNHGQSIAFAARLFGARAIVYVPEGANPMKVAGMKRLGAEIVFEGADFDACRIAAGERAERDGMYFVHSANEPRLIAGVATATLEILEAQPDLDYLIVPAGGGSGLSAACIVGKTIAPDLKIIGVQAAGAPVIYESWKRREILEFDRADTFAEGLATRVAFSFPARIIWPLVDDICLVSDREMKRAMLALLESAHIVAEGAGAASLAAAWSLREELKGKKVACMVSGGNVTLDGLKQTMDEERSW
jgi:threonine dehydratase